MTAKLRNFPQSVKKTKVINKYNGHIQKSPETELVHRRIKSTIIRQYGSLYLACRIWNIEYFIYEIDIFTCRSVPFTCRSISFTCRSVSFTCRSISFTCRSVPFTCRSVSFTCRSVPFTCRSVPFTCRSVPFTYTVLLYKCIELYKTFFVEYRYFFAFIFRYACLYSFLSGESVRFLILSTTTR